jgi:hypothetical protein
VAQETCYPQLSRRSWREEVQARLASGQPDDAAFPAAFLQDFDACENVSLNVVRNEEKKEMYTLNASDIAKFDLATAPRFVEFWSQFFDDKSKDLDGSKIDYFTELNIGRELTKENIRKLLRWKDPRLLTHPNKDTREDNPKVVKVLKSINAINQFRSDETTEDDIRRTIEQVFRGGIVWKAFLLHIAKPNIFPIADVNVLEVWSLHTGLRDEQTWETYAAYCDYFGQIAVAMNIERNTQNITQLKRIDNALVVFGRFLNSYYRPTKN